MTIPNKVVVAFNVALILILSVPFYMEVAPIQSDVPEDTEITVPFGDGTYTIPEQVQTFPQIRLSVPLGIHRLTEPDEHICSIAEGIRSVSYDDDYELICALNDFVHDSITYVPDRDVYTFPEHWQTPCETLSLGTGDCEDLAVLFVALCRASGFECVLVVELGHMSTGVLLDHQGNTVSYDGKDYLTADPTHGRNPGRDAPDVLYVLSDGLGKEQVMAYTVIVLFAGYMTWFMYRSIKE